MIKSCSKTEKIVIITYSRLNCLYLNFEQLKNQNVSLKDAADDDGNHPKLPFL